jgi:glycine/D-amino acid oxidase-like deaminating enzyme
MLCSKYIYLGNIGGGIYGVCTAYFLSVHHHKRCVIVEKAHIAAGASGKAGGFLARGWASHSLLVDLYSQGFEAFSELAQSLPLESYREVRCYNVHPTSSHITGGAVKHSTTSVSPPIAIADDVNNSRRAESNYTETHTQPTQEVPWLRENYSAELLDHHAAQIVPRELVDKMLAAAIAHGTKVIYDTVDGLLFKDPGIVCGVTLQCNGDLEADKVLLCMGPWTGGLKT